jgi:hypothetical protein
MLLALLLACSDPPTPEEQVRARIEAMAEAAEKGDIGAVMEGVDPAYRDEEGLSRDNIKGLMLMETRQRRGIAIWPGPMAVEVAPDGQSATAHLQVVFAEGVEATGPVPEGAEVWEFDVELVRGGEDWRVKGHRRQQAR